MEVVDTLPDLIIPGSVLGAAVWLFWRLVLRSDARERDTFKELKEQRDYWRDRAEQAEHEITRYLAHYGPLDSEEH